jgi:VanZ family protein
VAVRKTGHFSEYFILATLAFRAFRNRVVLPTGVPMAFAVAVAFGDEFHQTFTALRTGSLRDVGYDCAGAFTALCLLRWWAVRGGGVVARIRGDGA